MKFWKAIGASLAAVVTGATTGMMFATSNWGSEYVARLLHSSDFQADAAHLRHLSLRHTWEPLILGCCGIVGLCADARRRRRSCRPTGVRDRLRARGI